MLKRLKIVVTYHAGYFDWLVCGVLAGWCVTASHGTAGRASDRETNFVMVGANKEIRLCFVYWTNALNIKTNLNYT
jgi:hypothetical protein